ncbi:MAG: hypothetical protein ACO3FI_04040 [Cyclobacteriaceae bacterium]
MRYLPLSLLILVFSCGPSREQQERAFEESLAGDSLGTLPPGINDEFIERVLQQIPSPLEVSAMLVNSGMKYNPELLNSPDNLGKYNTTFQKALAIGAYGSDLYYTSLYGMNRDELRLINPIKSLSNDLGIGHFFDMATIARLAGSRENMDSLLLVTMQNFNEVNQFLQDKKRSEVSVLMMTGGWLEAMYVLLEAYSTDPTQVALREHIGEQKIILTHLMLLYPYFQHDKNIESLNVDMQQLKSAFEGVEIISNFRESTVEIINGVGVIKDNSTTTVKITRAQVDNIRSVTSALRNKLLN